MNLTDISCISQSALELLKAAGFHRVDSLACADPELLIQELEKANADLQISREGFSLSEVAEWIRQAREQINQQASQQEYSQQEVSASAEVRPVNYESLPEVMEMLDSSPLALPLPTRILIDQNLPVSKIPTGIVLNSYVGDLEVRITQREPRKTGSKVVLPEPKASGQLKSLKPDLKIERIRNVMPREEGFRKVPSGLGDSGGEELNLMRAPRDLTNKGVNPDSRWYIHGVLHSHPISLYFGALATIGVLLSMVASVVSATLLVLSSEVLGEVDWMPSWLLVFPMTLPIFGFAYLIWGLSGKCRICNQKLFVHRSHLKNSKAHHVAGLGYVLPLCFQMIIFRWFRCSHCGTSVRLKE